MQFSDTSNKTGILQMIEQVTNIGDGNITGVAVKKAYFTNLINQWLQIVHQYILSVNKQWSFDDSNLTTFPFATTTVVNGQRDYAIPSTLKRVRMVEVMDINGKYRSLPLIDENDPIFLNEKWQEDSGQPTGYYMEGNSIVLYPTPDTAKVTAVAGIRVTYERDMDLFTVSDTTQEPGIDKAYHSILYYGPAYEWAMSNNVNGVAQLCMTMLGGFDGLSQLIKKHYSNRNEDDAPIITRAEKNYK